MRRLVAGGALLFALFRPGLAEAKDFRVHRDWAFPRHAAELVAILADYTDMCDHGCRYHAPTVAKAVVLSYRATPNDFYVWTSTDDIQDSSWFSHVTIQQTEHRAHLEFKMVPEDLADQLEKTTRLENDPATDTCSVTYDIVEEYLDGKFVRSAVSFTTTVRLGGIAAWIGGGIVTGRLSDAAHAVYLDLRDAKPPPWFGATK
ncbi:MAG TPA: hypothetical protein VHE30_27665 [Polyangiaceae bacterium]|nr:hypothetical protein [Polyangiaceae bacterium]